MSVISNFERKVEGAVDGAAAAVFSAPIEPAQIAKKAEKQMKREKLVGSGRQYAPTLYNVLVNTRDDKRLFGFYPTMASEIENYLYARGTEAGMEFDTRPLVRFIPDPGLKKGRFDVIAEVVAAPIIRKLRDEELEYYGLAPAKATPAGAAESERVAGRSPRVSAIPSPESLGYQSDDAQFSGLDVPVLFDDLGPDSSELYPDSQARSIKGALPGLSTKSAVPATSRTTAGADPFDGLEQEPYSVIGQARLFNCTNQQSLRLPHRKFTIGRGKENNIVIADANASRIHARFTQDATGRWKITDLGSTNGTQLNDRFITSAILKSGDEITIGTTVFQFTE